MFCMKNKKKQEKTKGEKKQENKEKSEDGLEEKIESAKKEEELEKFEDFLETGNINLGIEIAPSVEKVLVSGEDLGIERELFDRKENEEEKKNIVKYAVAYQDGSKDYENFENNKIREKNIQKHPNVEMSVSRMRESFGIINPDVSFRNTELDFDSKMKKDYGIEQKEYKTGGVEEERRRKKMPWERQR